MPVDDDVRPALPGHLRLGRTAHDRDHPGACGLAELHRRGTHAPSSGVDEQRLALPQPGPFVEREPAGLIGDDETRGLRIIQTRWGGKRHGTLHDRLLRKRAVREYAGADDAVSHRHVGDVRTGRHDLAARLDAGDEGQLGAHLVLPAAQQHVGEVRRRGEHPHAQLPRADVGRLGLGPPQGRLRLAVGLDPPGSHTAVPWSSLACRRPIPASQASGSVARAR